MPASKPFDAYLGNIHSQNGEDGVITEILNRLSSASVETTKWCVEYGAWDGKFLSNTFNLVEQGWNAIYIEGDRAKFKDLLQTADAFPGITPINAYVGRSPNEKNSLEFLLGETDIPRSFDLLSIDIDSYDLETWEPLEVYEPKIVVIEINSSIPPGTYHRCSGNSPMTTGNSFTSTLDVAHRKGYELVCHTGNMIFVKSDLVGFLEFDPLFLQDPSLLFRPDWLPKPRNQLKSVIGRLVSLAR